MRYSEELNGFWEEGYHYYLEIRGDRMTVRDYRRALVFETGISYDAEAIERGERTVIQMENNVISRDGDGNRMMEIRELAYDRGALDFLEYYTIMGEKRYRLKKVDHGPFDHIRIRDDEVLPGLQGVWKEWPKDGRGTDLVIRGNRLSWGIWGGGAFHAVSYDYAPDKVRLVPENLTDSNFSGFTEIMVEKDMLTTRRIIFDVSVPLTVFAREEMLEKIEVPPAALEPIRSTMLPPDGAPPIMGQPFRVPVMPEKPLTDKRPHLEAEIPRNPLNGYALRCPNCGFESNGESKFCPECGSDLRQ